MTRKKFIKQLMAQGVERNSARRIAQEFRRHEMSYQEAYNLLGGGYCDPEEIY